MIVVTGAAGRLGRQVVGCLVEKGYNVLGTDRVPYDDSASPFRQADLCESRQVRALLTDAEAVIHTGSHSGTRSR